MRRDERLACTSVVLSGFVHTVGSTSVDVNRWVWIRRQVRRLWVRAKAPYCSFSRSPVGHIWLGMNKPDSPERKWLMFPFAKQPHTQTNPFQLVPGNRNLCLRNRPFRRVVSLSSEGPSRIILSSLSPPKQSSRLSNKSTFLRHTMDESPFRN